ncbi:2-furoate---CoA ligase [Nocardioides sp. BE266]|uniref:class I adenylate-forming enzyme family protein n=1 Tax=Nocardioides sp. BE266 TaxID=2817725 RepID=UPI0028653565|nr:AMP-binding protein [Nocardioides sp. BE266]MDR7251330.1 2-furoate---CoA ligase [Nocardioides sp. BE266]
MDIATAMRWTAERYPHRRAVGGSVPLTYAEWDSRTDDLARALIARGATPGSRVVLMLQGGEPLASLHLAAQKAALTSVPLSTRFSVGELAYCIADCSPAVVVVDGTTATAVSDALATVSEAPPVVHVDDLLGGGHATGRLPASPKETDVGLMLYTSGTTGTPKGVPRSQRAEHSAAVAHLIQTGQPTGAVSLGVMPLFHTMGIRSLLASIVGAGIWVPQPKFDADESMQLILEHKVDTLYLVPTIFWSLLQTGQLDRARSVRRLAYAGAPMTPTLAEQLVAALQPDQFVNHFGSTEIYTFTIGPDGASKPGCAGRAGVFTRIRLVDPDPQALPDQIVGPGEQGQIAASMESPEAFAGYWNRPDADAKSIRDGWYFPGDLATADEDGDLWISGRVDDMINSGGENLYPEEIENALASCQHLDQVVVAGTPHDKWGSAVTAFVVARPGAEPRRALDDIQAWIRTESGLPSLKRPKRLVVVDRIPTSAVGKILRRRLIEGDYEILADTEAATS